MAVSGRGEGEGEREMAEGESELEVGRFRKRLNFQRVLSTREASSDGRALA